MTIGKLAAATALGLLAAAGVGAFPGGLGDGLVAQAMAAGPSIEAAQSDGPPKTRSAKPNDVPSSQELPSTPAAPAMDPSGWTIPQGEDATRRHMKNGLKAGDTDPLTGRRVLYYHDPMVPGRKFDSPGKSPFMDMMLVPSYAGGDGADSSTITVSARVQQNLGLRTTTVSRGRLETGFTAVGAIAYNERDQAVVQARALGFVEKVHVRATLDRIRKGGALVDVHVPAWVAAQQEYLSIRRMRGTDLAMLVDAARARMRQAGMTEAQVRSVEEAGEVQASQTIVAPIGGVVSELMVREGMTVMPGMTLFKINGIATVWANAEVPESQSALLRPGSKVVATSPAVPGTTFEGRVQAILPVVDAQTRTVKARLQLDNPQGRLVPGMFAQMRFSAGGDAEVLLVPTEAVIHTGRRAVVMIAEDGGRFRPAEVQTGAESTDFTEVRSGLDEGEKVVLSGQFLIESEGSLKGLEARLNAGATAQPGALSNSGDTASRAGDTLNPATGPDAMHRTEAILDAIDDDTVTLTHPPIPSLKWPKMTMGFHVPPTVVWPAGLTAGERIVVEFQMRPDDVPAITTIKRIEAAATKQRVPR